MNEKQLVAGMSPECRELWARQNGGMPAKSKPAIRGGYRSKTEAAYALVLEGMRERGEIVAWFHEPMALLLDAAGENRKSARYLPDFLVIMPEGWAKTMEFVEVKGGKIWDGAIDRFRWARSRYPWFGWRMIQRKGKGGSFEDITP